MLILTRKIGQGVLIGENIEIVVTEISGDKVRIGIEAPRDVKVLRMELRDTVEENQQAASVSGKSFKDLALGLKKEHEKTAVGKDGGKKD